MQNLTQLTKSELSSSSLCKYDDQFPYKKCLERTCEKCSKIPDILAPLQAYGEKSISWCHWEYIIVKKGEENKRQISCVEKSTTVSAFLEALQKDLQTYPQHLFRANWQHRQMAENQKSLKEGEIQLVMDFSENYRCAFKDEVQTGFFDQVQVTLHPMMAYYFKDGVLIKHVIVGISPDTRHDAHQVKVFKDKALNLISENTEVRTVYEWTDGCAAQYKGKHAFADISLNQTHKVIRSFFETSHGKGVCDGIGAVVKNVCFRAVVTGKAILGNAEMVFKYCKQKLGHGPEKKPKAENEISIWDIIYSEAVGHDRAEVDVLTLKGTRLLHSIQSMTVPYKVATRTLSCFCKGCLSDGQCLNSEWVDQWTIKELKLSKSASDSNINATNDTTEPSNAVCNNPGEEMQTGNRYDAGSYVAVNFEGRNKSTVSVALAKVNEVQEEQVHLEFLKKTGSLYVWPEIADIWWHPPSDIICALQEPELLNERKQYRFNLSEIKKGLGPFIKHVKYI